MVMVSVRVKVRIRVRIRVRVKSLFVLLKDIIFYRVFRSRKERVFTRYGI